jgi:hypothetical protein
MSRGTVDQNNAIFKVEDSSKYVWHYWPIYSLKGLQILFHFSTFFIVHPTLNVLESSPSLRNWRLMTWGMASRNGRNRNWRLMTWGMASRNGRNRSWRLMTWGMASRNGRNINWRLTTWGMASRNGRNINWRLKTWGVASRNGRNRN